MTEQKKRITYHIKGEDRVHNFASRDRAIDFGRALSGFGGVGKLTVVWEQERHDSGVPSGAPSAIWSRIKLPASTT